MTAMADAELDVYLGEVLVGHLRERNYRTSFSFVDEYLEAPRRPVLGQWFEDRLHEGPFFERHGGLPLFFENLLPSDALRLLIKVQHQLDDPTDLDVLAVVGEDLPGATILRDRWHQLPIGFEDSPSLDLGVTEEAPGIRFSLAGLHLKFSLIKQGHVLTLPARGEHGRLIVKIPLARGFDGIVENEHAMMTWADASGFEVPRCEIITAERMQGIPHQSREDTRVYCVERFDRRGHERVHQEDLAQVLGIDPEDAVGSNVPFGYGGLGLIMGRLLGAAGLDEYLRRIALMVASGNEDAHIKNWSIIYPNGHTPGWSPLYDQVATIVWEGGAGRGPALRLGGAKEWHEIDVDTVVRLAREAGCNEARATSVVDQALVALKGAWRDVQDRIVMLPRHRQALAAHWQKVPLLRRMGALEA
jgi:serine/threonine-protein kinase HipA